MSDSSEKVSFIDTHCHIDDPVFDDDRPEVIDRTRLAGVDRLINIAYRESLWQPAFELEKATAGIRTVVGLHPNHANEWDMNFADRLREVIRSSSPVAIGETGLDYFRDHASRTLQIEAFDKQLSIAGTFGLPVVLHLRGDVEDDLLRILRKHESVPLIFHSFDGSRLLWDYAIERGHTLGAGGIMTKSRSSELRQLIARTPLHSLVLETDSPYLSPKGWKHRRNTPESIPLIAKSLAELKGVTVETVATETSKRAKQVFALSDQHENVVGL